MKTSELTKELQKIGCYLTEHGRNHDEWFSPVTGRYFQVPRHKNKDIPKGTEHNIRKDAGLKHRSKS